MSLNKNFNRAKESLSRFKFQGFNRRNNNNIASLVQLPDYRPGATPISSTDSMFQPTPPSLMASLPNVNTNRPGNSMEFIDSSKRPAGQAFDSDSTTSESPQPSKIRIQPNSESSSDISPLHPLSPPLPHPPSSQITLPPPKPTTTQEKRPEDKSTARQYDDQQKNQEKSMLGDKMDIVISSVKELDLAVRKTGLKAQALEDSVENNQKCLQEVCSRVEQLEEKQEDFISGVIPPQALAAAIAPHLQDISDRYDEKIYNLSLRDLRSNLVFYNIKIGPRQSSSKVMAQFFAERMGLPGIPFKGAKILGRPSDWGTPKPVKVFFADEVIRNQVWWKRNQISHVPQEGRFRPWMKEDLPYSKHEEKEMLFRIQQAAITSGNFRKVVLNDFELELDDKKFMYRDIPSLPPFLQPPYLYTPRNERSVVFFTKNSPLSNHFPSPFYIEGTLYEFVEKRLAVEKARFYNQPELMVKLQDSTSPAECKAAMRGLETRDDQAWHTHKLPIMKEAIRAKFSANPLLAKFLKETGTRKIGEASARDRVCGTGIQLFDVNQFDSSKWTGQNHMGRILMEVRHEICQLDNNK